MNPLKTFLAAASIALLGTTAVAADKITLPEPIPTTQTEQTDGTGTYTVQKGNVLWNIIEDMGVKGDKNLANACNSVVDFQKQYWDNTDWQRLDRDAIFYDGKEFQTKENVDNIRGDLLQPGDVLYFNSDLVSKLTPSGFDTSSLTFDTSKGAYALTVTEDMADWFVNITGAVNEHEERIDDLELKVGENNSPFNYSISGGASVGKLSGIDKAANADNSSFKNNQYSFFGNATISLPTEHFNPFASVDYANNQLILGEIGQGGDREASKQATTVRAGLAFPQKITPRIYGIAGNEVNTEYKNFTDVQEAEIFTTNSRGIGLGASHDGKWDFDLAGEYTIDNQTITATNHPLDGLARGKTFALLGGFGQDNWYLQGFGSSTNYDAKALLPEDWHEQSIGARFNMTPLNNLGFHIDYVHNDIDFAGGQRKGHTNDIVGAGLNIYFGDFNNANVYGGKR